MEGTQEKDEKRSNTSLLGVNRIAFCGQEEWLVK